MNMKRTGKNRNQKSRKKSPIGKVLLFVIPIGIGLSMLLLFHQEIYNSLRPWVKRVEKRRPAGEKRDVKRDVLLYFSDPEGEYLIGEKRKILKKDEIKEEAKEMIVELIKGPRGKLIPTLPPRTKLLALLLDERGMATVNFNKSLSKDHPGGSSAEMMTTYSIVNSLTLNFPQIKRVQILVEGKTIETISGHLSLRQPVSSKPDLIKNTGEPKD